MKICAAQAMMALIVCGVSAAHDNYAQLLDRKVTLSLKEVPLEIALKKLESATNVRMFYSIDQLDLNESISIEAKDETLRVVLDELLSPHNIKYKVNERKRAIILKKQTDFRGAGNETNSDTVHFTYPQHSVYIITGTVLDATTQQPMAGVNIIIKGTTVGTTTDSEGSYSIQAEDNDILVFSFIGYATYETSVTGRGVIDVSLKEDTRNLGEVVINAGYWQVTDKERTGNITKVTAENIQKQPVQNPLAALQGRVPGLEITQQTGVPGGNFTVRIRGTNSIANGNDPLYIVDGVPFTSSSMALPETSNQIYVNGTSPLNSINPSDIESIEVLKDADATAIYGSRAANGVILITTKKGQAGKSKVDFKLYTGFARVARKMDLLNSAQYLEMRREAFANDNIPISSAAVDLVNWDTTRYTDWQEELIGGTAQTTDAQFSISGGDATTHFFLSSGYHRESTVFPGDNADRRISVHSTLTNTSPNKKLKTSISINYALNLTNLLRQDLTSSALSLPPVAPALYDEDGKISWTNWSPSYENPIAYTQRIYEASTKNLIGNATISYLLLPGLELKSNLGYTHLAMKGLTTRPISSQAPVPGMLNSTSFSNTNFENWVIEPQLNWKPKIGLSHFDVLIGTTFMDQITDGLSQSAYGFSSESLMRNFSSAPNTTTGTNYYSQYRYHAVFGRINYSLKGRYILNLTARRDGSSRFGPGKQFSFFSAAGAAWIFSEESFFRDVFSVISFGKLRTSYGTTGNDQLGDYQYLDTYSSSPGAYLGTIGLQPDRLSNPDFAWETNRKFEASLELGLFDNRILGGFSYYRNRSSSQLVGFPLPATTGFTNIQGNFPAIVQNTGIEIEISTQNIETPSLSWSSAFNISLPQNELVEFPNIKAFPAYMNTYVVGEPLSIRKLYNFTGIDRVTGLYTFEDVDGDGLYNINDRQIIEFIGINFSGGLQNSIQYKGIQLDVFFQFVKQRGYTPAHILFSPPGALANQPMVVMNRWTQEGDNSETQRFSNSFDAVIAYSRLSNSQQSISDASFVRLKNISLSYSLPTGWLQKNNMGNVRFYIHAQNLLLITNKYKGLDPETQFSRLPPLQVFTGGIQLTP